MCPSYDYESIAIYYFVREMPIHASIIVGTLIKLPARPSAACANQTSFTVKVHLTVGR